MSAKREIQVAKVGHFSGVISLAIVTVFSILASAGIAELLDKGLWVQRVTLSLPGLWRPDLLVGLMTGNGFLATLAAFLIISLNSVLFTAIATFGTFAITRTMTRDHEIEVAPGRPRPRTITEPNSSRDLIRYAPGIFATLKLPNKHVIHDLFPQIAGRMRRAKITPTRAPKTPIDHLTVAVLEVLAANKEVPAAVTGHHAGVSLFDHSRKIAKAMATEMPKEPLAYVAGLAHDIGKTKAFIQEDVAHVDPNTNETTIRREWVRVTAKTDDLSAEVVRELHEFTELTHDDRRTLTMVLAYSHKPHKIPTIWLTERVNKLVDALRRIDHQTTREEHMSATDNADKGSVIEQVKGLVTPNLKGLNINGVKPERYPDGWASVGYDYVAVKAESLREALANTVSSDTARALSLREHFPEGKLHPGLKVILRALDEMGLLVKTYEGINNDPPLFALMSGRVQFADIVLLDRTKLEEIMPEELDGFGDWEYSLKVMSRVKGKAANAIAESRQEPVFQDPSARPPIDF